MVPYRNIAFSFKKYKIETHAFELLQIAESISEIQASHKRRILSIGPLPMDIISEACHICTVGWIIYLHGNFNNSKLIKKMCIKSDQYSPFA